MIRTRLIPKFSDVFYPILHFSLGPKNVGYRSTLIEEAYGYLWLLVQEPNTGALMLYLVKDVNGGDYNWVRGQSIPPAVSYSNPVTLYLPEHENIVWATFAFTEEGEPLFAIQRDTGGTKRIQVYDREGNLWMEITNAKSPFIVPEALINRKVVGSNVYVFYVPVGDSEIRYQGIIDTSDRGSITSVPVNVRNDLFIVDYVYRTDGIELVYSTPLRNFFYVHIEAEAYHVDEEVPLAYNLALSRVRKAIRDLSRVSIGASLVPSFVKKIYLGEVGDSTEEFLSLVKGEIKKTFVGSHQDPIYLYPLGDLFSISSLYRSLLTDSLEPGLFGSQALVENLYRQQTQDDASAFTEASGKFMASSHVSQDQDPLESYFTSDLYLISSSHRVSDHLLASLGDLGFEQNQRSFSSQYYDDLGTGFEGFSLFAYQSSYLTNRSEYCSIGSGLDLRYRQTSSS